MNFLSHFYLDGSNDHKLNFGLLFPDFLGIIDRSVKVHQLLPEIDEKEESFKHGISLHVRADAIWHNSDYFKFKTELIGDVLRDFEFYEKPYRPFFMTHVMLEILLDRMLLLQKPDLATGMYNSLEGLEKQWIIQLFSNEKLSENMPKFVSNFTDSRYVYKYSDNAHFIYALNRLFKRVGLPGFEFQDHDERDIFVNRLDHCINTDYEEIFSSMRVSS